jgi:hypothetical protein
MVAQQIAPLFFALAQETLEGRVCVWRAIAPQAYFSPEKIAQIKLLQRVGCQSKACGTHKS